ncbi:MAG: hypothetical protein ACRCT8_00945 [Lacipirellulaceae bacterium]
MPDESPPESSLHDHLVVVAIDGLRAAALGAYGQTTYSTPTFDRLAAEGEIGEWRLSDAPDLAEIYDRFAEAVGRRFEVPASVFVSEDAEARTGRFAAGFAERFEVAVSESTTIAQALDATAAATVWSGYAERLVEAVATLEAGERLSLWVHSRGLGGPWDAPVAAYDDLIDDEDPEVEPSVAVPHERFAADADADAPEACDARFAAATRYAGQVRVLDSCLGGWLELADELFGDRPWTLVLFGLRGFALGEHGLVGLGDRRLFSESIQVPFFVSRRGGAKPRDGMMRRGGAALLSEALAQALLARPLRAAPLVCGPAGSAQVVRDDDWMLRRPGADELSSGVSTAEDELYVKPDDRWEQNNIASLKPEVVEGLAGLLAGE